MAAGEAAYQNNPFLHEQAWSLEFLYIGADVALSSTVNRIVFILCRRSEALF